MTNTKQPPRDMFSESMEDPELRSQFEREWLATEIILQIEKKMEEQGVSRKTLAERLGCKPPNVTQLLRKGSNLTLGSMVDVAMALGQRFLAPKMVPINASPPWQAEEMRLVCKTAPWSVTAEADMSVGSAVSSKAWTGIPALEEAAEPHAELLEQAHA